MTPTTKLRPAISCGLEFNLEWNRIALEFPTTIRNPKAPQRDSAFRQRATLPTTIFIFFFPDHFKKTGTLPNSKLIPGAEQTDETSSKFDEIVKMMIMAETSLRNYRFNRSRIGIEYTAQGVLELGVDFATLKNDFRTKVLKRLAYSDSHPEIFSRILNLSESKVAIVKSHRALHYLCANVCFETAVKNI